MRKPEFYGDNLQDNSRETLSSVGRATDLQSVVRALDEHELKSVVFAQTLRHGIAIAIRDRLKRGSSGK